MLWFRGDVTPKPHVPKATFRNRTLRKSLGHECLNSSVDFSTAGFIIGEMTGRCGNCGRWGLNGGSELLEGGLSLKALSCAQPLAAS